MTGKSARNDKKTMALGLGLVLGTYQLSILRKNIADTGTVWVSWPKKSAGVATDITEDVIRAVALPLGFVDVKVCAVDETWSGLKLMIRREQRKKMKRPHLNPLPEGEEDAKCQVRGLLLSIP